MRSFIFLTFVKPGLMVYLEAFCIVGFVCVCLLVICIPLLIRYAAFTN